MCGKPGTGEYMSAADTRTVAAYDSPALGKVDRGALCAGCGGCALAAPGKIEMRYSGSGYLRPVQTAPFSAEEENRVMNTCPGLGQAVDPDGRTDDAMWGPYVNMRTGHACDERLRFVASSGGGLSGLLVSLLASGKVDAVYHNRADPDRPLANIPVISETAADILAGAGSRYAPSAPLAGLAELADDPRRFAFVGKPCDVAALRALQADDPKLRDRFPVLISFFCAGVPSLAGAEAVLTALDTTPGETVAFRYRGHGWPGRATATHKDGSERSMTYHDSWGLILSRHVQHRCKLCADGAGMAADAVFADAWVSDENGYPLFEEEAGQSLIVARTELGAQVLEDAEQSGHIASQPFDVSELDRMQKGQVWRRRTLLARIVGLAATFQPYPRYENLHLADCARRTGLGENLKFFFGMIYRVAKRRGR